MNNSSKVEYTIKFGTGYHTSAEFSFKVAPYIRESNIVSFCLSPFEDVTSLLNTFLFIKKQKKDTDSSINLLQYRKSPHKTNNIHLLKSFKKDAHETEKIFDNYKTLLKSGKDTYKLQYGCNIYRYTKTVSYYDTSKISYRVWYYNLQIYNYVLNLNNYTINNISFDNSFKSFTPRYQHYCLNIYNDNYTIERELRYSTLYSNLLVSETTKYTNILQVSFNTKRNDLILNKYILSFNAFRPDNETYIRVLYKSLKNPVIHKVYYGINAINIYNPIDSLYVNAFDSTVTTHKTTINKNNANNTVSTHKIQLNLYSQCKLLSTLFNTINKWQEVHFMYNFKTKLNKYINHKSLGVIYNTIEKNNFFYLLYDPNLKLSKYNHYKSFSRVNENMFKNKSSLLLYRLNVDLLYQNDTIFLTKDSYKLFNKDLSKVGFYKEKLPLYKCEQLLLKKDSYNIHSNKKHYMLYKSFYKLWINNIHYQLHKELHNVHLLKDITTVIASKSSLYKYSDYYFLKKSGYKIFNFDIKTLYKNNHKLTKHEFLQNIYKDGSIIDIYNDSSFVSKCSKKLYVYADIIPYRKVNQKISIPSLLINIKKDCKGIYLNDINNISLSINQKSTYIDKYINNVYKEGYCVNNGFSNNIHLYKKGSNVCTSYIQTLLNKEGYDTIKEKCNYNLYKKGFNLMSNNIGFLLYKRGYELMSNNIGFLLYKDEYELLPILESKNVYKNYFKVECSPEVLILHKNEAYCEKLNSSIMLDKKTHLLYKEYHPYLIHKDKKETNKVNSNISVLKEGYSTNADYNYIDISKKYKDIDKINYASFIKRDDIDVSKGNQKLIYVDVDRLQVPSTDKLGFVKDFLPPIDIIKGAVDELLLPREKFEYSEYKEKVFIDNYCINSQYLKGMSDEGNPIVNVPIENPINYYADIALDYIDVDVGIMKRVLELLYHHWRKNIHSFAGVEASRAIERILKSTHEDIKVLFYDTFDKKQVYHAERSLKLFAWYSEMSLMTHSLKEIIYTKANATFDYGTGSLPTFTTANVEMKAIDKIEITSLVNFTINNNYIISSTTGVNAELSLKHMPQHQDTKLNFKGYIVNGGSFTISTSDSVYAFTSPSNIVCVNLPEYDNSFCISFTPDNENSYLDISSFYIEDRYNIDYKLEYTGKVSNVNFTIQYILDFMSCAGDTIEDVNENGAFKTTAQIAYALEQFREYMKLHHENKMKGKRLTIKR